MKYAVIDQTKGDWFEEVFDTEAEAVSRADYEWHNMTDRDKSRRIEFYVASCSVDEYGCVNYDTIQLIKEYV